MKPALALLFVLMTSSASAQAPARWTCEAAAYEDTVCDCGCGAVDPDCTTATFEGCARSACPEGKVPWEHAPESCMTSACGDGWKDDLKGEVCDDGNAIASGGCSADCKTINSGHTCGERAEKCALVPADEPAEPGPELQPETQAETQPETQAETTQPERAESDDQAAVADEGCAGANSQSLLVLLLPLLALRIRRTGLQVC